jgi:threonine dehydrogenase-like Zn-dependent dehydrogenase
MIEGDEGCYLLPIQPDSGFVETALVEPWACVVSAYVQSHRGGIKPGGSMLIIAGEGADKLDWAGLLRNGKPGRIALAGDSDELARDLAELEIGGGSILLLGRDPDWALAKEEQTRGNGFDDILVLGAVPPETVEVAASTLANHGIMNLVCPDGFTRKLSLDIGRIHYNWHHYIGTNDEDGLIGSAYLYPERSAELTAAGITWFIGAGGPMGQMHVQRAITLANPPRKVVATDIDAERLQSVRDRFGADAERRGVELITLNPNDFTEDLFDYELRRITEDLGFDDIVSLVPVPKLIEHAADFLAPRGLFNIFAGVARGTMANLNVNDVIREEKRFIGSSGSSIADMRQTLEKVESKELSTNMSLAAIGGMRAAREGIAAVKEGRFPGKTLIFPLIPDLPLTPLTELKNIYPSVYVKLKDGQFWTKEAEEELLRLTR